MKMKSIFYRAVLFGFALLFLVIPGHVAAQSTGSIEFSAHVAPTDGQPEPVRQLTFCLIRKSLDDIRQEALQSEPPPDLDKFIDALSFSPLLKAWMKKHRTVDLAGTDFAKNLTADDIVDIPEFYDAYMSRNVGFKGVGFPDPKFKEKDRTANPEKYEQQKKEYKDAIRKFIVGVPESVHGIEADMIDINPATRWLQLESLHRERLEKLTLELAQTRYVVARTDTNLEGKGWFGGVAPGDYWIGMLGAQAVSGDVRIRWDFPVTVRPGEMARVELTNYNAAKPYTSARNSNP
jgi:hypothetical protein